MVGLLEFELVGMREILFKRSKFCKPRLFGWQVKRALACIKVWVRSNRVEVN